MQADLFAWLRDIAPSGQRFDVVVLDPSKQTRDREDVDFALKKYLDMNRLALLSVAPGGIFLTCSCTGLVSEEAIGTRRIYRLDAAAVAALREQLDDFWNRALGGFGDAVERSRRRKK